MTSSPTATASSVEAIAARFSKADRPVIWIDGQWYAKGDAKVSVFDHGLLYGDGVFEGIRVYNGQVFKCRSHLDRIFRNAEAIHMHRQPEGFPYTPDQVREMMEACIAVNQLRDGYIRLIFTRGVGTLGLHPFKCPRPGVICIADQIQLYPEELYQTGMRIIVAKRPRTPAACLDPRLKSLNYLNNILAKVEAIDADCLEAIMLSYSEDPSRKIVGECTGDNLFIVKDGHLLTSPLDVAMLDGITRGFVIRELAPALGLKVIERRLSLDEVLDADEVFLTGSAAEIIAVTQIDDTKVSDGEGPITARLRAGFREVVSRDVIPAD